MSDRIDELADAIGIDCDYRQALCGVSSQSALTELATIARRWRKVAIHLATVAAEASVPTHFTTTDAIARATEYHLASAMFCQDDGTLFRHPENALAAARVAVTRDEA